MTRSRCGLRASPGIPGSRYPVRQPFEDCLDDTAVNRCLHEGRSQQPIPFFARSLSGSIPG